MELFELILVLLACVIASSILEQVFTRISLPLVQIAVGLVVALVFPHLGDVHVESELFLVLFIAPLLYCEARESNQRDLWTHRRAIVSMAIALVLATVLVMGFMLNYLVPSIPLAAAFACAAALGPTDAAAVSALGSTVTLNTRQKTLLSGEALINDASGVVSFQFAVAAAVTGAFSMADASTTFAILFFGGIIAGAIMGALAYGGITLVRSRGFENTTVHVIYEVFTPFVVFLAAESLHVSGILAVVAAGLVMSRPKPRLESATEARHRLVSHSVWEVIVFLINGVIFVLLGMQLPFSMAPAMDDGLSPAMLLGLILMMTSIIIVMRFAWIAVLEAVGKDRDGKRLHPSTSEALKDALVTTIAGPKGSVTLSIILTMPLYTEAGTAFPSRDLIIFLTAGTILATLLIANYALPLLARTPQTAHGENDADDIGEASIRVLSGTLDELRMIIDEGSNPEFEPAMQLAVARYRTRLARLRLSRDCCGNVMEQLMQDVLDEQQKRADKLHREHSLPPTDAAPFKAALRRIRASIGYFDHAEKVGSHHRTLRGAIAMAHHRMHPHHVDGEQAERVYFEACLFAIELENAAIDYLGDQTRGEGRRAEIAEVLIQEHQTALNSLRSRINTQQGNAPRQDAESNALQGERRTFAAQKEQAHSYADEVDAMALSMELNQIRMLREDGEITEHTARILREDVYALQMQLQHD